MLKKLPFKISARTARLIGRQNFPNSEGAITELVKNSYDADADICIILFDNKYIETPQELTINEYEAFAKENSLVKKFFKIDKDKKRYQLEQGLLPTDLSEAAINNSYQTLEKFFKNKCKFIIIDNGEGMTDQVIENFWMTIGTNNKEIDVFTKTGRIKTGAKGIGRFALDKLGDFAKMTTKPSNEVYNELDRNEAFIWNVNWNNFEGNTKTLGEVEAEIYGTKILDFSKNIQQILPFHLNDSSELQLSNFTTGTIIEISALRDTWDDKSVEKLFKNLEVLIPPREERIFNIFVFSTLNLKKYGQVSPSVCDDFDYKVKARVDAKGMAEIIIHRNEFDIKKFPKELFNRPLMKKENFTKADFERGQIKLSKHISQLAPGLAEIDSNNILDNIGPFEFIFYFIKNQVSNEERKKFFYRDFNAGFRKKWLIQFGGLKLFRDNFRVRPYGETNSRSFDWLLLGERAGRSPQSLGQRRSGYWRVRPNQISGIINISRLANIKFEDTSSRYGLQENNIFDYFTEIIIGILAEFEKDRTKIGQELSAYYEERQLALSDDEAQSVKKEIIENVAKRRKEELVKNPEKLLKYTEKLEDDSTKLVRYTEQLKETIELMKNETSLLRILATNSLIIASFTHELKNIKNKLVDRIHQLKELFKSVIDSTKIQSLPDFLNPFTMLEDIKKDDEKLKQWLHYSLETLRKDKRRRTNNDLIKYFKEYKMSWQMACDKRGIEFKLILPQQEELKIRVFEADLDSIFNNLLINSFEAFLRKDAPEKRTIAIELGIREADILFTYTDSGPGLSKDITDPESIFEPHETTKRDPHSGEEIGTGLGMWLVRSLVNENNGHIHLLKLTSGFGVSIEFLNKLR